MGDPWEDAAASRPAATQTTASPTAPAPDNDPWEEAAKSKGASSTTTTTAPTEPSATSRLASGVAQGAGVVSNEEGKNFFLHPIDTAKSILKAQGDLGARAGKELSSGDYVRGLTHGAEYLLPGVGPSLARAGDQLEKGDYAGGIGTSIGAALPIVAGKAIPVPAMAEEGTAGGMGKLGATPKAIPLPPEEAARGITKAVNPAVNEWPNYIKANAQEAGNIKDFAAKNNLPLKTQLDWARAARGVADESRAYFNDKVLGPHAGEQVSTTGSGYKGANSGEGQTATLSEVNKRIVKINDELNSAYQKRESGQTREALANEPDLVAERDALTDILHKELAKRTGMTPEEVAGIRQRVGRTYSIADKTEAAVNQRQSSAGKAAEGRRDVPTTVSGAGVDLFNRVVRGGPEGIANRAFVRSIGKTQAIPASELPEVNPPTPTPGTPRPLTPRNELPQGKAIPVQETSPEEIAAQQQKLRDRVSTVLKSRHQVLRRPIWQDQ